MGNHVTPKRTALILCIIIALFIVFDVVFWKNSIESSHTPYNLILISIDTLRPDHLGVYGYDKNTSPNIDAFAKQALVFTDTHTLVPATYPSFTSLMTGLSPFTTSVYNNGTTEVSKDGKRVVLENKGNPRLKDNIMMMAEALLQAGYTTAGFVGNPVLGDEFTGMGKGFETYTTFYEPKNGVEANAQAAAHAVDFLQSQNQAKKPFFLWVHVLDPHSPYTPSIDVACKMNEAACATIKEKGLHTLEDERKSLEGCQEKGLSQSTTDIYEALYDGEIRYSDGLVGQVFDTIKRMGLEKNSIIVFYGDHGEGFDHDYYFDHGGVLYESATHIPLIISTPDYRGTEHQTAYPVTNTEVFPTVLQLLHLRTPLP
jgi:arylsulfatase